MHHNICNPCLLSLCSKAEVCFFTNYNRKEYSYEEGKGENLQDNMLQRKVLASADKEPGSLVDRHLSIMTEIWIQI